MNYQRILNKDTVVPGGFRFRCPHCDKWFPAPSWTELLTTVKKHYKANEIPIGLMFENDVETQLCSFMPPGICSYSDDRQKRIAAQIARPNIHQVNDFTALLGKRWFGEGLVTQSEAEKHALICSKCPYNQTPDGCTSCTSSATATAIGIAFGTITRHTPHDDKLQSCLLCKCHLKAKVWAYAKSVRETSEVSELVPDWCWVNEGKESELEPT
jgi:hypothetical protein